MVKALGGAPSKALPTFWCQSPGFSAPERSSERQCISMGSFNSETPEPPPPPPPDPRAPLLPSTSARCRGRLGFQHHHWLPPIPCCVFCAPISPSLPSQGHTLFVQEPWLVGKIAQSCVEVNTRWVPQGPPQVPTMCLALSCGGARGWRQTTLENNSQGRQGWHGGGRPGA